MKYRSGEEFLNKIYKDLHKSSIVEHTMIPSDTPSKKIEKYMNRLENIHIKADTEHRKNLVKRLYYDKYVIKRDKIDKYEKDIQDEIINKQERSLDKWIDYLTSDDSRYPMWAKYWAFQGMLKIGTYDEKNDTYGVRSEKTIAPFMELNPEVLDNCINMMMEYVKKDKLTDEDILKLVESGNFKKIYTTLINKSKSDKNLLSGFDGVWIKYNYGSRDDGEKLYESLQGYNTGWCTAGCKNTAINQVCGGYNYQGGDFYVYYTKNDNGEYKRPRIAIRMDGTQNIGEIRGVDKSQNVEEGFEEVIRRKLDTMEIDDGSKKKYMNAVVNAKMITLLNRKVSNNQELGEEEILFLFRRNIDTFGWEEDPRITDMKNKIVIDNYDIAMEAVKQNGNTLTHLSLSLKNNREIVLEAVKQNIYMYDVISDKFKYDEEIMLAALKQDLRIMENLSSKVKNNKEFMLKLYNFDFRTLEYASRELRNDREFMLEIININPKGLTYATNELMNNLSNDRDFMLDFVKKSGLNLYYGSVKLKKDKELVLVAVRENIDALYYVSDELRNDKEFMLEICKNNTLGLEYVPYKLRNDKEFMMKIIKNNGLALKYASRELQNDFIVAMVAVMDNLEAIEYVSLDLKKNSKFIKTVNLVSKFKDNKDEDKRKR